MTSRSQGDFTPERKKSSLLGREGKERERERGTFPYPSSLYAHMSHVVLTVYVAMRMLLTGRLFLMVTIASKKPK